MLYWLNWEDLQRSPRSLPTKLKSHASLIPLTYFAMRKALVLVRELITCRESGVTLTVSLTSFLKQNPGTSASILVKPVTTPSSWATNLWKVHVLQTQMLELRFFFFVLFFFLMRCSRLCLCAHRTPPSRGRHAVFVKVSEFGQQSFVLSVLWLSPPARVGRHANGTFLSLHADRNVGRGQRATSDLKAYSQFTFYVVDTALTSANVTLGSERGDRLRCEDG